MRPFVLDPLFISLRRLSGVGEKLAGCLEKLCGPCIIDLLWHLPVAMIDRRHIAKMGNILSGQTVTVLGTVLQHTPARGFGKPFYITLADDTDVLQIVHFKNPGGYLEKTYPLNSQVVVSGVVEAYQGRMQMVHPERVGAPQELAKIATLEPIYSLTAGVTNALLRKLVAAALDKLPKLPEWLDQPLQTKNQWPKWHDALTSVHHTNIDVALDPMHPARQRLAYDELLAHQLSMALLRHNQNQQIVEPLVFSKQLDADLLKILPFELTQGQKDVWADIVADLCAPSLMCRLVQGDVGSGKTVLALLAAAKVISSNKQAAIMAPTEILARQHFESLNGLCESLGINCALLTRFEKGKAREKILADLAAGTIDLLIGTHALIQETIQFSNLGLAVIDEQHRFGVGQRLNLSRKGQAVHVLVMTATPIPRTLALTLYGDMTVSILAEKPPGRLPINTRLMNQERLGELVAALERKIAANEKIYWVCPLVEESEFVDLAAATERYTMLQQHFGAQVGLIHGRLKADEKAAMMHQFTHGNLKILVATTVIEVGVNVSDATVMIIEHAERFGLSQLHQLRGRVGRGIQQGTCILLYAGPLGKTAQSRLEALRETNDGFRIAEEDLRLRGAGELLGTRQSGEAGFRLATPEQVNFMLPMATDDARLLVDRDGGLASARGQAARTALYLFERDAAVGLLRSG